MNPDVLYFGMIVAVDFAFFLCISCTISHSIAWNGVGKGHPLQPTVLSNMFPMHEYLSLNSLYESTNGTYWDWTEPYDQTNGYPWNFDDVALSNPCNQSFPWQGVVCSTDCSNTPCNVIRLVLPSKKLKGKNTKYLLLL